ncbi:MAG TPA: LysR family transcriptional regulator [Dyella sp.]|uniref:LysR family transcriptional regulator n=1 Tax=Dyella sp. TaxID=1869338 RepID=UPI002F91D7A5
MEAHEIRYALAVYRNLNFTRAAAQCFVTTPALSRGLRKLEDELGSPLFERDTHGVKITAFGKLMRPHLEQIADGMAAARAASKQFLVMEEAPLKVGVMCTIGPARFLGFLGEFRQHCPGCQIQLSDNGVASLTQQLLDGTVDLAVMAFPAGKDARFDTQALYRERFCVAVPAGHPFGGRESIPLAEAVQEPHLLRDSCEYQGNWLHEIEQRGLSLPVAFRSEREDWIQTMIAGGFGVSFLPEYSPLMPGIQLRPFSDQTIEREVSLVHLAGKGLGESAKRFVEFAAGWVWD